MFTPLLANLDLLALATSVGKIVFLTFLVILPLVSISVYFERRISAGRAWILLASPTRTWWAV